MGLNKKTLIVTSTVIIVLFLLGSFSLITRLGLTTSIQLDKQLNDIIATQNILLLKKICANKATFDFINSLPNNTKCTKTSDFQGLINGMEYYVTVVDSNPIDVFLIKDSNSNILRYIFPKWNISKIKIQSSSP